MQTSFFGAIVEEINRDRGPAYICHTGHPDRQTIKMKFEARFGFEPAEIFEDYGLTWVGPAPDRDFGLSNDGEEQNG